jgi:hypothetical protein
MTIKSSSRRASGSALAEFGPALFVLLIIVFFPMLNLMTLPMKYVACFTLNTLQLREAALVTDEQGTSSSGPIKKTIPDKWLHSGQGAFVKPLKEPLTEVVYGHGDTQLRSRTVAVKTEVLLPPFIAVPFHIGIPGLGDPITFSISQTRVLERES